MSKTFCFLIRLWGRINECELPVWSRSAVLGGYSWIFGCNLEEAVQPDLKSYKNLGEFFRRRLKEEARVIDSDAKTLVSPCDGKILHFGEVDEDGRLAAVKGVKYPLKEFLGFTPKLRDERSKLYHFVVYLAPGDYHGFHSPTEWDVISRNHFKGLLLSVSPKIVKSVPRLFNINERVVYTGSWKHGFFSLSAVGATNVGSVVVPSDKSLKTNCTDSSQCILNSEKFCDIKFNRGEYFGEFNLGSTIVVIFEAPSDLVEFNMTDGDSVKMGKGIIKLK